MTDTKRWQIAGVSLEARDIARNAAKKRGISVGDWLDNEIKHQTGLDVQSSAAFDARDTLTDALDALPADMLDTLHALEERVAARAADVEAMLSPLEKSVDGLSKRLQSVADNTPQEADPSSSETPFFTDGDTPHEEDVQIADAAVASDVNRLFAQSEPPDTATDTNPLSGTAPIRRRETSSGLRSMLVAAGIVLVLIAIAVTFYQWTTTSTGPATGTATPAADREPDAATKSVEPAAPPAGTTAALTGDNDPSAAAETPIALGPGDPSLVRPASPSVAEGSMLARLHAAATGGETRAQYDLAIHYIRGQEIARDYAAASYWLRQAATSGMARAQYNLGVLYDLGLAGPKDPVEALLWFDSASEQGHARATYAMGLAYNEGKGVPRDSALAATWFRKAAYAGVADAQFAFGVMLDQGIGVPSDAQRAYYWYRRAEIGGNEKATGRIAGLGDRLSKRERIAINDEVSRDTTPGLARPASARQSDRAAAAKPPQRTTLSQEDRARETVRAIQRLLAELGFNPGAADGDPGPRTSAAITEYQRALDLPADGLATRKLLAHLRDVAGLPPEI